MIYKDAMLKVLHYMNYRNLGGTVYRTCKWRKSVPSNQSLEIPTKMFRFIFGKDQQHFCQEKRMKQTHPFLKSNSMSSTTQKVKGNCNFDPQEVKNGTLLGFLLTNEK